jgi:hypothetical protein
MPLSLVICKCNQLTLFITKVQPSGNPAEFKFNTVAVVSAVNWMNARRTPEKSQVLSAHFLTQNQIFPE